MLELPDAELSDINSLADWAELNTLTSEAGVFSATLAADALHDSGKWGFSREDIFPDDYSFEDEVILSQDEDVERLSEYTWTELNRRATVLLDKYPFRVEGGRLVLTADSLDKLAAFGMLLLSDVGRQYSTVNAVIEPNSRTARLFEKVVEASLLGLFGGVTCRFGWPIEPGWPTGIEERIRHMGDLIGLEVEDLAGKTTPRDKDRGLDVVAGLSLGDQEPGSIFFLVQCATGKNWREKKGEPSLANWRDILKWNAKMIRIVAIPWRLDENFDRKRAFRHFDAAVIMDRERLLFGAPDHHLEESIRKKVWRWCQTCIAKIPKL